jgi:hypothetical protein
MGSRLREKLPESSMIGGDVPLMGAQIMFRKEEYASGMGQRFSANNVAVKDAQMKLSEEECA